MKRRNKILLISLGVIALLFITIYIFKAGIIVYFLRTAILKQSDGDINLNIKDIQINWIDREISLVEPDLEFKNRYLDSAQTIQLTHLLFERVDLKLMHFRDLIFDNLFIADQLIVDKPRMYFVEETGKEQFSLHPDRFMATFGKGSDNQKRLDLEIRQVEVNYGSIRIKQDTSHKGEPEIIDFTIILKNLNTNPTPEKKAEQILFADDLIFEIKNLHKIFVSGYHLSIDSIHFSSKERKISLNGSSLIPDWFKEKGKNRIALSAKLVEFKGIDLTQIRGKEDLSIRSVYISKGYFSDYYINTTPTQVGTARVEGKRQLSEFIHQFRLDTLSIQEFQLNQIRSGEDSVLQINDFNLSFYDILLDSAIFKDPFSKTVFGKVFLNTGSTTLDLKKEELAIHYDSINYSSEEGQLIINGVDIQDIKNTPPLVLQVSELRAENASPNLIQTKDYSSLEITLNKPFFDIDLNHPLFKTKSNEGQSNNNISVLPEIRINNGRLKLSKGEEFNLDVSGLSAHALKLDISNGLSELKFRDLSLQTNSISGSMPSKNISLTSRALTLQDNTLDINNIIARIQSRKHRGSGTIRLKNFRISEIEPSALISDTNFIAGSFLISSPQITGNFDISQVKNQNDKSKNTTGGVPTFPMGLNLKQFELNDGVADASIYLKDDTAIVKSSFAVQLQDIILDNEDSLNTWIELLKGSILVKESDIHVYGHKGMMDELLIDLNSGKIRILNLNIHANKIRKKEKIRINSFELRKFDFCELRFAKMIKLEQLDFRKLLIDDLHADIKMKHEGPAPKKENDGKLKRPFDFRYDTISWTGMQLKFDYESDLASTTYSVNNLNIKHKKDKSVGDNLIRKIHFSFDDFKLNNNLDDSYLLVKHGHTDPNRHDIIIDSLIGGNFIKVNKPSEVPTGSRTQFQSNKIMLKGLYVKDTIPTKFAVGRLEFDEVELLMIRPEKEKSKTTTLKLNIEMFRKYAYLMTALSVDTTIIRDTKLRYRTTHDTSSHLVWADSIGLIINKINIDTTMFHENDPDLIENLSVDFKGRSQITKDSLYEIESGRLHYNFPNRRITIDSLMLTPRFDEAEFFKKAVYQTDRMKLFSRQIVFDDFHVNELINENKIHFGSLDLYNIDFRMVRDKRYPNKPGKHTVMIQDAIKGIGQKITIDSIKVVDSFVEYGEYSEKSDLPGTVYFDQFNIKAYNFTNDSILIEKKKQFSISLDSRIMGEGKFNLVIHYDMASPENNFWMTAKSEELDLTILNPLTKNIMGIFITSGTATLDVPKITGNDYVATGTLMFRYKKLKMVMYDRHKSQVDHGIFTPIVNFLINDIIIISNNPRWLRKEKTGLVYFERNTEKSVVNYAWKSIFSGMISTAGFNTKEQRQEKKELKNAK